MEEVNTLKLEKENKKVGDLKTEIEGDEMKFDLPPWEGGLWKRLLEEQFEREKMKALKTKNEEDKITLDEDLNVFKTIIEDQKKELRAVKSKAAEDQKKHEKEVQDMVKVIENDRNEVKTLKMKIAEKTNKADKNKHIVKQLSNKIECPVCLEVPRASPVPVCPNGHIVCKTCKTKTCPTCSISMGNGKSLLAFTVIENIEHKCKFDDCEEYLAFNKLNAHTKVCSHRTVRCPYYHCDEKVCLSNLLDHFSKEKCSVKPAPVVIDKTSSGGRGQANYTLDEKDKSASGLAWKTAIFSYGDASFAIFPEKKDGLYYFSAVMFASEAECSKYRLEIELNEGNSKSQDAEVSFRYCGKPCSIDANNKDSQYLGLTVNSEGMGKIFQGSSNAFTMFFSIREKC